MVVSPAMNRSFTPPSSRTATAWLLPYFLCTAVGLSTLGCDDEKKAEEEAAKAKAAQLEKAQAEEAAVQAVAAAAAAAKKEEEQKLAEKKPAKKLEDCGAELQIDDALQGPIRLKAQKPEGEISVADLKKLRSLNLSSVALDELDICVFRHMTELRELFLGPGQVTDLAPIVFATKLESFRGSMNPIEDLSPLSKMTKMDRLDLGKTQVKDLSPLSGMTLMTELMLDGAPVEDIAPLSGMKILEKLSLAKTQVKDVKALSEMKKLEFLYIAESPLSEDISATGVLAKNGTKIVTE